MTAQQSALSAPAAVRRRRLSTSRAVAAVAVLGGLRVGLLLPIAAGVGALVGAAVAVGRRFVATMRLLIVSSVLVTICVAVGVAVELTT